MARVLKCGSVVPGCQFVAHGESDADILHKLSDHARGTHGIERLSSDLKARVRSAIQEEEQGG